MNLPKLFIAVIAMALAATAFPSPAIANEEVHFLQEDGSPLEGEGTTVNFLGSAGFALEALGGIMCDEVTATVTFTTSQANVTEAHAATCHTVGAFGTFCDLISGSAPTATSGGEMLSGENSWTLTPTSASAMKFANEEVAVDLPAKEGCIFGEDINMEELEGIGLVVEVVVAGEIGSLEISGELFSESLGGPVPIEGELTPAENEPTTWIAETE